MDERAAEGRARGLVFCLLFGRPREERGHRHRIDRERQGDLHCGRALRDDGKWNTVCCADQHLQYDAVYRAARRHRVFYCGRKLFIFQAVRGFGVRPQAVCDNVQNRRNAEGDRYDGYPADQPALLRPHRHGDDSQPVCLCRFAKLF
ncbi:hypothetical protein D3C77_577120 [compost metagenome]